MTPVIQEMREALDADIEASASNELARFDPASPDFAGTRIGSLSKQLDIPLSAWGFATDALREGEIVIKRKGMQIVIPHSRNPFLDASPVITHHFESEISRAKCVTAKDALDIVFEDDGVEIAEFLERLGLTFQPVIAGSTLRFARIDLIAA